MSGLVHFFKELFLLIAGAITTVFKYGLSGRYRAQLAQEYEHESKSQIYLRVFGPLITLIIIFLVCAYGFTALMARIHAEPDAQAPASDGVVRFEAPGSAADTLKNMPGQFLTPGGPVQDEQIDAP